MMSKVLFQVPKETDVYYLFPSVPHAIHLSIILIYKKSTSLKLIHPLEFSSNATSPMKLSLNTKQI